MSDLAMEIATLDKDLAEKCKALQSELEHTREKLEEQQIDYEQDHKIDQYAFACRLLYQLHFLQSLLHQYVSALSTCSVELFMKIGTLYMEMAIQEKALDYFIELLRKDQLDENVNLDGLVKSVMYFFNLYSVHLASEQPDCTLLMGDHMKLIGAASTSPAPSWPSTTRD